MVERSLLKATTAVAEVGPEYLDRWSTEVMRRRTWKMVGISWRKVETLAVARLKVGVLGEGWRSRDVVGIWRLGHAVGGNRGFEASIVEDIRSWLEWDVRIWSD